MASSIWQIKTNYKQMNEPITLTTPALLFSAISLIMLAYTNRFMSYATLIRTLHEKFKVNQNEVLLGKILWVME